MEKGNEKKKGVLVNRTKTNGIRTYYELHGDGPPLVLIHGVSLDHNLNIKNPIVCGLSTGGIIAQMFAVKYPAQLRALIIADSAAKFRGITLQEKLLFDCETRQNYRAHTHYCWRTRKNGFSTSGKNARTH